MRVPLVADGQARAALVIGNSTASFERWVVGEIQRYVRLLSGVELPVVEAGEARPRDVAAVLIGSPATHPLIGKLQQAEHVQVAGLKPDGFILKSLVCEDGPTLVVSGATERSTMYAAYELIERLGVSFQLTSDILPTPRSDLGLPMLDVRLEPAIKHRGLHMRHFVMPWMGYADFCQMIDQMAKLKCNYLEFYWYVGGPWIEYSYRGERNLIGDLCHKESGYTAWRCETGPFSTADVIVGREHLPRSRPCAPEFQNCQTPAEAHRVAQTLLTRMIEHAHQRKIDIWLGAGDCPCVPANLGRQINHTKSLGPFGSLPPLGDSAGVEIWTAMIESTIATYPAADGHWLWLSEGYHLNTGRCDVNEALQRYDRLRHLIPGKSDLIAMGYDQYLRRYSPEFILQSDLGLIHYGTEILQRVRQSRPHATVGLSLLGRSYLFPAFDAVLPKEIPLQSMESAVCWNRSSRVPMENFARLVSRETFLVPRLDDDESAFAMQFNAGLYEHDRVLSGSHQFGVSGIAPQMGRTRGLETNTRYIADGCWNPALSASAFYDSYAVHTFGTEASAVLAAAYKQLDANELFLGLQVDTVNGYHQCFQGMGNFPSYCDSTDIGWLRVFKRHKDLTTKFDFTAALGWLRPEDYLRCVRYRLDRFERSIETMGRVRTDLLHARPLVQPGARGELDYVISKTEAFILHLRALCSFMQGMIAYHESELKACEQFFSQAENFTREAAGKLASCSDHPGERFLLFRYNVRQLLPIREFRKYVHNLRQPPGEPVDWNIIRAGHMGYPVEG